MSKPRMKEKYQKEALPSLMKAFGYKNVMQVPRLEKAVVNMGVGGAAHDSKLLDSAMNDMAEITGQRPRITKARKSISNFKIREGNLVGCKVTLRGARMYEFLDRLFNVALPRVRDFGGVNPDSFDGRGNFALGLREQLVFPEIDYNKMDKVRGMDIIIVTNAKSDEEARALLKALGMPFREAA